LSDWFYEQSCQALGLHENVCTMPSLELVEVYLVQINYLSISKNHAEEVWRLRGIVASSVKSGVLCIVQIDGSSSRRPLLWDSTEIQINGTCPTQLPKGAVGPGSTFYVLSGKWMDGGPSLPLADFKFSPGGSPSCLADQLFSITINLIAYFRQLRIQDARKAQRLWIINRLSICSD
jgi:hypothetical protein